MKVEIIAVTNEFVECRYRDTSANLVVIMKIERVGALRILFQDYFTPSSYSLRANLVRWWVNTGVEKLHQYRCVAVEDLQPDYQRHLAFELADDAPEFMKRFARSHMRNRPNWPSHAGIHSPAMKRLQAVFA